MQSTNVKPAVPGRQHEELNPQQIPSQDTPTGKENQNTPQNIPSIPEKRPPTTAKFVPTVSKVSSILSMTDNTTQTQLDKTIQQSSTQSISQPEHTENGPIKSDNSDKLNKYNKLEIYYNQLDKKYKELEKENKRLSEQNKNLEEENKNLKEENKNLKEENKTLLAENINSNQKSMTYLVTPQQSTKIEQVHTKKGKTLQKEQQKPEKEQQKQQKDINQQLKEKFGEIIAGLLKNKESSANDEFEKINVELFDKQGMIAQNNHNILFDSSKTTTINRRKLQTGIQGNKQMNGIVGKQHVIIFVLTDNNDLFGIYHHNKIQLNDDDFNEDDQFFLFSLAKNGVYNPTIWEREGGNESINIYDPGYDDDILEVYDAFIIHKNSFIEVSKDFKQSYKCDGDDNELISKEKPKMKKLFAIEWN
ncbi:hypothetical protein QTN25_005469 [Entamoeba marina]